MQFNVAQLLKEPIGSTRNYQLDEKFTGPHRYAEAASGLVHMLRTHQGILVRATVDVTSILMCSLSRHGSNHRGQQALRPGDRVLSLSCSRGSSGGDAAS